MCLLSSTLGTLSLSAVLIWYLGLKGRFLQAKRPELRHPDPEPPPILSVEIIEHIADFLFEINPPADASPSLITCIKPSWLDVAGFMNASPELHRMGWVRLMAVLTVRSPEDWEMATLNSCWVKELNCLDGALLNPRHRRVLTQFDHLYAVSIDAHSDISHDDQNHFAYRGLVRAFPPSLRRLEITRAHGPDIKIIAIVKECCPGLEELRLGRCTVFNSSSVCDFWRSFPFDHDSYMSSEGTESYAHSLARELAPLQSLQTLRIGLYLIPSTTVLAHRLYHRRNLPAPDMIDWQQAIPLAQLPTLTEEEVEPATPDQLVSILHECDPETEFGPGALCEICVESVERVNREAETRANAILGELLPRLCKLEWMNWLSPGHLGINAHAISAAA